MKSVSSNASYRPWESERFPWPLVFLLLTTLGAFLLDGGYAHYEGQFFLVNYLDVRGPFSTIFSAHFNEWDCYQGRELSFLFGWLDAEIIRYSARLGWVHLYSATHYAGLFGAAILLWRALSRIFPELHRSDSGLIVALLLTTPAALFSGYYYRPAKILTAFFLAAVLSLLGSMRERSWVISPRALIALGAAATLLGLSDRLGVYLLLLLLIVIVLARRFDRANMAVAATLIAALALNAIWSAAIGPRLSALADGNAPDTIDQIVRLRFTFLRKEHYAPALALFADHIEYFFGNFGIISLIAAASAATLALSRRREKRPVLAFCMVVAATVALYVAMYARLTSLPWPASRRVYYWLPQLVVVATGAAFIIARGRLIFPRAARLTTPVLALMIVGNLVSIPRHRAAIRSQEHRPWIVQSPTVRECIRERSRPVSDYTLDAPYAQLCGAVRAAVEGVAWTGIPAAQPNPRLYCRNTKPAVAQRH